MGCASSRFSSTEESLLLKSSKTGFEVRTTDEVVGTIRRYALNPTGQVNPNQLLLIKSTLSLEETTGALKPFYDSVAEVGKLIVAGVLLSKGSAEAKATALFEVRDETTAGKLTSAEVTELLTLVLSVAVDSLPLLVVSAAPEETTYLNKSRAAKESGVQLLKAVVMGGVADSIDTAAFVKNWANYSQGKLLEPSGLREFLTIQPKKT